MSQSMVREPMRTEHTLGPFLATMIVASGTIGGGIFLLPASLGAVGSVSILSWIAATGGALLIAGAFSALAIMRPRAHSLFSYVQEAFGPGAGFTSAAIYWLADSIANAPVALGLVGYLSFFIPGFGQQPMSSIVAIGCIWILIGVTALGPRVIARLGGWTLLAGLAPILLAATAGWFYFSPDIFLHSWNVSGKTPFQIVPATTVTVFFAFLGIEGASVIASLVRNPARNVPIATLGGTLLAAMIYMLASTVVMGMIPAHALALSTAPFADATRPFLGAAAAGTLALCAVLRSCGTIGVTTLVAAETAKGEAMLGQIIAYSGLEKKRSTNLIALAMTGILCTILLIVSAGSSLARQFTMLVDVAVVLTVITYLSASLALWQLGANLQRRRRSVRAIAAGSGLFSCWLIAVTDAPLLLWTAGIVALSVAAYLPVRWRNRRLAAA